MKTTMHWIITWLLVIQTATLVLSEEDLGYHECTYNTYRATCLNNTNPYYAINRALTQFPAIAGYTCVMLSNNKISQFPSDLSGTETIITMNLQDNLIRALPYDLTPMEQLEILDLSRNKMPVLSHQTRFPVSLKGLLLSGNKMKTLPSGIRIPGLYVFDLSSNLFETVPEHFCVSDQLFRVDLTGNPIRQDLSLSFSTLNRCRNSRNIPYCLFTDHEQLSCDCPTLAMVVGQKQRFCLGTPFRGREIKCKAATSSVEYRNQYIFDVNATKIKESCSYTLLHAGGNSAGKTIIQLSRILFTTGIVLISPWLA